MKKKLNTLILTAFTALAAQAQVLCKWDAESSRPSPAQFTCYRGETLRLQPTFREYGTLVTNATYTLYWQTNGMGTAYWSTNDATCFRPSMDVGASSYTLFIGAAMTNGISYRANAIIRMLGAPGAIPNTIPLPVQQIDFAAVSWTNSPWLLSSVAVLHPSDTNGWTVSAHDAWITLADVPPQTNQVYVSKAGLASMTGKTNEWIAMSNGTATLFRVYNSGFILQGYGSPDYMGVGPSAPPDTYIFQTPSRLEDGGITEVYDIPMASGYIYPFSLAISTAGIFSQIVIGSPQLSPSLWRTFETNYPVLIPPFPDEPGVEGGWVLSKITDPITNSYPLALVSDIPASIPQTNQLYVAQAGTVTGSQSNTIASALQPGATNGLVTAAITNGLATTESLISATNGLAPKTWVSSGYVATGRTVTVNGQTGSLQSNLSFTVTAGLTGSQITNIVQSITHTNQTWAAAGTNATYQLSWDTSNKTFRVLEILP